MGNDAENKILLKYKDGARHDAEDSQYIISQLELTGLLRCGLSFDSDGDFETLRTTNLGLILLKARGIC